MKKTSIPLRFEISGALFIKLLMLFILWSLCFSQATPKSTRALAWQRHLLNQPATTTIRGHI